MPMDKLKTRINEDMKTAMKAQDKQRLGTIRMLMAAIKQREIDEQITLNDQNIISTITKMIKQRQEAATQYHDAGRPELAAAEEQEIVILKTFLPTQLAPQEIERLIDTAIKQSGAQDIKDMGKIMAIIKPQLEGRADLAQVSATIKRKLA